MQEWGMVLELLEETSTRQVMNVQLLSKECIKAMHFIHSSQADQCCAAGDIVCVNVVGLTYHLGTGGYGFISAQLNKVKSTNDLLKNDAIGHSMKVRYTGQQTPVCAIEEEDSRYHSLFQQPFSLENRPILVGELHSMLPILALLIHQWQPGARLAYIMDDQACLHLPFSDHIRELQAMMNLTTITTGQATGGDVECINLHTGLEAAIKVVHADHIIVTQGPGVIGTRTPRGFSGMGLSNWIHAVYTNGGQPIVIPRIQFADTRPHHVGLSRHTWQPLIHHTLVSAFIPYPIIESTHGAKEEQMSVLQQQFEELADAHIPVPISLSGLYAELQEALHTYVKPVQMMGKDIRHEPFFFYGVAAAFDFYRTMVMRYDETRYRDHDRDFAYKRSNRTGEAYNEFRGKNHTDEEDL